MRSKEEKIWRMLKLNINFQSDYKCRVMTIPLSEVKLP